MNRREFLGSAGSLAVAHAIGSCIGFAQEKTPVTAFHDIRKGMGYFTGRGGSIGYYISPESLIVVDTQMPGTAEICLNGLGIRSTRTIDLLINSHHHYDHTGGNGIFKPKAPKILAHKNVPELQRAAAERSGRLEGQVYANTAFGHTWEEKVGDVTVSLRYWGPAHTGGDAIIHFVEPNVVHMGDLVFNHVAPYIDTQGGASTKNWIAVLEAALKTFDKDSIFVFGHGSDTAGVTGGVKELEQMKNYLGAVMEHAEAGVKAGKSEDEIASILSLKGFEEYGLGDLKERFQSGLRETVRQITAHR